MKHLVELRKRLLYSSFIVMVCFIALVPFATDLYTLAATPLLKQLPTQSSLLATSVTGPIVAPLKLTLILSLVIAIPFVFLQLWHFIAPALYKGERKFIFSLALFSTFLFYLGASFAYFMMLPLLFSLLVNFTPSDVIFMPDIINYLNFILRLLLIFGFAFQLPLIVFIMVSCRLISIERLEKSRPYVIVGAFILGMLLTPPDVFSQIFLAIPLWLLFELGLFFAKLKSVRDNKISRTCS